jgi:hypothetical protein
VNSDEQIVVQVDPGHEAQAAGGILEPPARQPGRWVVGRHGYQFWPRADVTRAVEATARALANLGVRGGQLVAVSAGESRPSPLEPSLIVTAVENLGAEGVLVPEAAVRAWPADVLITDSAGALAATLPESLKTLVVYADPLWSDAFVAGIRARHRNPLLGIHALYAVPGVPGPLAITCAEGRLHGPGDEEGAVTLDSPGPVARVLFRNVPVGDLAEPGSCPCGSPGVVLARILGPLDPPRVDGRPVYLADVARALWRTPGFGGSAEVAVTHDRGRGRDYVAVTAAVDEPAHGGVDPTRVEEALWYSLTAVLKVPVRVTVSRTAARKGITLIDRRIG